LKSEQLSTDPETMLIHLSFDAPRSVEVIRAYVALKLPLDRPARPDGLSPLTLVTRSCVGNESAAATTAVLVQAGANPSLPAVDGDKTTPLMEAVACPAVLKAMLARKPNLSVVDAKGYTVMHHALSSYEAREEVARIVLDAGFDLPKWRPALLKEFGNDPASRALLEGRSTTATVTPTPGAPRGAIDWKATGPYPARSRAEATALLARPGVDDTAHDHFWDAINEREPQRLALALQAGADVRQSNMGSDYTPLMSMADGCDDRNVEAQVDMVQQLVAAKADVTAVSANKSNALMVGAHKCPIAVLRLFIAAGVPVNGVDTSGNTAMKLAILHGRADVVTALIEAGVDPRKEPYNAGRMATGNKEVQEALKQRPRK
jgi:ankyrin repeat protein